MGYAWHSVSPEAALQELDTTREGLSEAEHRRRLDEEGPNALPATGKAGWIQVLLRQFKSPLIYILVGAAAISIVLGKWLDAGFIGLVIAVNTVIGTWQELRAEQSAEALQQLIRHKATVRREGKLVTVDAEEIVTGDVVLLESGSRVPADLRLLSSTELGCEEAFLTGESLPVDKDARRTLPEEIAMAERITMAFAGALVIRGRAEGVVIATGRHTALGELAREVVETVGGKPPLLKRIESLSHRIGWVAVVATMGVGGIGVALGNDPMDMLLVALTLAVSAIPEGLPISITVALAVAVHRMARRGVIVRRLAAVEGLGSCTFIASDKTGTLTCNAMTARQILLGNGRTLSVTGEGFVPDGEVEGVEAEDEELLGRLVLVSARCNEASLERGEEGEWNHRGDPTEIALLTLARKVDEEIDTVHRRFPDVHQIPFESERRYAATVVESEGGERILVKGSPEMVLSLCAMSEDERERWADGSRQLAAQGLRVLGFADGRVPSGEYSEEVFREKLEFVGFVGLIDPLRPRVVEAVEACRRAGIEVAMITGDHPVTARAIAQEIGVGGADPKVVMGGELEGLDQEEFSRVVATGRVFARVSPGQKLAIVEETRAQGHLVAVTGDGANDAPALKAANIGVAMGRAGTDVAREASELVITDDNFATIVDGVEEGRIAFANIRKVFNLLGSCGLAEVFTVAIALFAGLPLPLLPLQILWLNLVTNGIQDKALAIEGAEEDVLRRPPSDPKRGILDRSMIGQIAVAAVAMTFGTLGVFHHLLSQGYDEAVARSSVLMLMVFFQNVHLFNCRSEHRSALSRAPWKSPWLFAAAGLALGVHLMAGVVPFLSEVLELAPIPMDVYAILIPVALSLVVVMEIYKALVRARHRGERP
jgi:P-type Ca2+ transporter type 2C